MYAYMYVCIYVLYIAMASSMSEKYRTQALDTIPAVEMPCTLTNPYSQSLDWVRNTGNRININT